MIDAVRAMQTAVLCLAAAAPAYALQIEGLQPMHALEQAAAAVSVRHGALEVVPEQGARLRLAPWHSYLPAPSARQVVSASRLLHPAGPIDRLTLADPGASAPWLIVLAGARVGHSVVGPWTLARHHDRWQLQRGSAWRALRLAADGARPARVRVNGTSWCILLLPDDVTPPVSPGVTVETEAQATLVAFRGSECR